MFKKLKFNNLSQKILAIVTMSLVIPVSCITTFSTINMNKSLKNNAETFTSQVAKEKSNLTDIFIGDISGIVNNVSKAYVIGDLNKTSDNLKNIYEAHKDTISQVFIGHPDGKLDIYPKVDLGPGYNCTTRSWYKSAVANDGKFIVADPYQDLALNAVTISTMRTFKAENGETVVIGADVRPEMLFEKVSKTQIGSDGFAFVVTPSNIVATHKDKDAVFKKIDELYPSWGAEIKDLKEPIQVKDNDTNYMVSTSTSEKTGWKIVTMMSLKEMETISRNNQLIALAISFISLLASIFIIRIFLNPIIRAINTIKDEIEKIADGDLSIKIVTDRDDEIGVIQKSINSLVEKLKTIISDIGNSAKGVSSVTTNLAISSENNVRAIESIDKSVENATDLIYGNLTSVEEATASVSEVAKASTIISETTIGIKDKSSNTLEIVENGKKQIDTAMKSMSNIKNSAESVESIVNDLYDLSKEINIIIQTIRNISEQTNLLSINASIEAARAGDFGKGFSVVASEVRKLAEGSKEASSDIEKIISNIQGKINETVNITKDEKQSIIDGYNVIIDATETFNKIVNVTETLSHDISEIAATTEEQTASVEEISSLMHEISNSIGQTAKNIDNIKQNIQSQTKEIENFSSYTNELESVSNENEKNISIFKL